MDNIFVVPVGRRQLLWSPLRQLAVLLNAAAVDRVRRVIETDRDAGHAPPLLADGLRELSSPSPDAPRPPAGPMRPMFLGIIPTRRCNLSCVYCDFDAAEAPDVTMEYETAVRAIEWMAETAEDKGYRTMEVHFFGGEPFVAGDVVDVAVHRARAAALQRGLMPYFEVATNGVFDEDRRRFVRDYFDAVILSFDGHEEIHNLHRPMSKGRGSFAEVAGSARSLDSSALELCFRTCVSHKSVDRIEGIARWFSTDFHPAMVVFETLLATDQSEAAGLRPPDPYAFAVNFHRAAAVLEGRGIKPVYPAADTSAVRYSFCPLGKDTVIVSPDGRISSCYLPQQDWQRRGLDLDVGRMDSDGKVRIDRDAIDRLRALVMDKPLCDHCFCRWTCAGGCHVNNSRTAGQRGYDDFCIQTRILTARSLLKRLGRERDVHEFLGDRGAMERLALQPSDRLGDWNV